MKRIRQAVVAARDLARVEQEIGQVFGLEIAYRDPGVAFFGLVNAVLPVGTTFLEVVSPSRSGTTASRFLERRGDAGYMLLVQTDDLAGDRRRLAELGIREVWSAELDDIAAVHLHPSDTGGAILSLDQPVPASSWRWGGPDWERARRTDIVDAVTAVEFGAREPSALAVRWARILGKEAAIGDTGRIALDGSALRFVPIGEKRREGLAAIELHARSAGNAVDNARRLGVPVEESADELAIIIAGTRFLLT